MLSRCYTTWPDTEQRRTNGREFRRYCRLQESPLFLPSILLFLRERNSMCTKDGVGNVRNRSVKRRGEKLPFNRGEKEAYAAIAAYDEQMIAPEKDVLHKILIRDHPCLILIDDLMDYVFHAQTFGMVEQCYRFLQDLTEQAHTLEYVVVLTFPTKDQTIEMDMSSILDRYQSLLSKMSQATPLASESEWPEIIRRRLFHWDSTAISPEGNVLLSDEALETCHTYSQWIMNNRGQLPGWIPFDQAEQLFRDAYPFHPAVFSVLTRKWRSLPHFQYTRGILRLLALWMASVQQDGYRKVYSDPLISLGAAPLEDLNFRTAVREQPGTINDSNCRFLPILSDVRPCAGASIMRPRMILSTIACIRKRLLLSFLIKRRNS